MTEELIRIAMWILLLAIGGTVVGATAAAYCLWRDFFRRRG